MKALTKYILERFTKAAKKPIPQKAKYLSYMDYEDVTEEMVEDFWKDEDYAKNLVPFSDIDPDFQKVYKKAKKNVAVLERPMSRSYTVYFDKDANLLININSGASWSNQNFLHHYADKFKKFKLETAAYTNVSYYNKPVKKWELLYNGKKY